jgi:hypothetical protein
MSDVPVDSLRQRVTRLIDLIETGTFGKSDVESLAPELRAALGLPDFAVHQQERLGNLLDDLRYSGGLHRSRSHVMFANDLADWLESYRGKLASALDRQQARLARVEKSLMDIKTETRFMRAKRDELLDQRSAIRTFLGLADPDNG